MTFIRLCLQTDKNLSCNNDFALKNLVSITFIRLLLQTEKVHITICISVVFKFTLNSICPINCLENLHLVEFIFKLLLELCFCLHMLTRNDFFARICCIFLNIMGSTLIICHGRREMIIHLLGNGAKTQTSVTFENISRLFWHFHTACQDGRQVANNVVNTLKVLCCFKTAFFCSYTIPFYNLKYANCKLEQI